MVGLSNTLRSSCSARRSPRPGFSLIELVIVVVIIGIIAAIAIPRMSRGSQGAADSALAGNLSVLRNAIDLYQTEHQSYPAPALTDDQAVFERQLTKYTDSSGGSNANGTKSSTYTYGPYLRKLPPLPVGPATKKGASTVKIGTDADLPGVGPEAWLYNQTTGDVKANLLDTEVDSKGTKYNAY